MLLKLTPMLNAFSSLLILFIYFHVIWFTDENEWKRVRMRNVKLLFETCQIAAKKSSFFIFDLILLRTLTSSKKRMWVCVCVCLLFFCKVWCTEEDDTFGICCMCVKGVGGERCCGVSTEINKEIESALYFYVMRLKMAVVWSHLSGHFAGLSC